MPKKLKRVSRALSTLMRIQKASWLIKSVNRRLARYDYWTGYGERRGLFDSMRQNERMELGDLVKKVIDFGNRFHKAIDQGDREIGSAVYEWRQLVDLFRYHYEKKGKTI